MPSIQSVGRRPASKFCRVARAGRGCLTLALAVLAGCAGTPDEDPEGIGLVEGFAGIVVADEPRAALLGRDILGSGGNAADAATTMYFAMTVTYPSRVGLGGGGVCVVFDRGDQEAEALQFLPRASGGHGVVPQGARAMAALHARHGLIRWEQLLGTPEALARFGHPVSRAFARDLAAAGGPIAANEEMARIFRNNAGALPGEGDKLVQLELASVLGGLRAKGAAYLYSGLFTRRFAEAAAAAGQPVTPEEVRETVPVFTEPVTLQFRGHSLFFTAPPAVGGLLAAQLWGMLAEVGDYEGAEDGERAHLFAEASARAFAQRAGWMSESGETREAPERLLEKANLKRVMSGYDAGRHTPSAQLSPRPVGLAENPHGASFVVIDRWANAVACSFTMNGLFGAFQMAPATGILLAAMPQAHYNGVLSPSAAILANTNTGDAYFAGAASGGSEAPTALVSVMLGALLDEAPLKKVLARPRVHHSGAPDITFYEKDLPPGVLSDLQKRGHLLREAPELGRVNALYCEDGIIGGDGEDCRFATDPRGWGLGFSAH
jgi:gamma-glutamyltranspeptidase/glutathione hydrolase